MHSPPDIKSEDGYHNAALASQEYRADVDSQMSRENPENRAAALSASKPTNSKLAAGGGVFQNDSQPDLDK